MAHVTLIIGCGEIGFGRGYLRFAENGVLHYAPLHVAMRSEGLNKMPGQKPSGGRLDRGAALAGFAYRAPVAAVAQPPGQHVLRQHQFRSSREPLRLQRGLRDRLIVPLIGQHAAHLDDRVRERAWLRPWPTGLIYRHREERPQ